MHIQSINKRNLWTKKPVLSLENHIYIWLLSLHKLIFQLREIHCDLVNCLVSVKTDISLYFKFRRVFHHYSLPVLYIVLCYKPAYMACTSCLSHFPALISEVWHKVLDPACLGDLEPSSAPYFAMNVSCLKQLKAEPQILLTLKLWHVSNPGFNQCARLWIGWIIWGRVWKPKWMVLRLLEVTQII